MNSAIPTSARLSTTFKPYGGYSPNPLIFLTAVAQRTTKVRLITGAVPPAFNSPLKMAGEIGMLDGISAGRLELGFARAFLPHEFAPLWRSIWRQQESVEAKRRTEAFYPQVP
jgi:alkanesulfonate monooxygenase SsuD/methylene tetrahydromethanopterin reductase-like flavin-dependent oxidoreductase (luciferase family)